MLRVFAVTHQHHAAHGLDTAFVERTAPEIRAKRHAGDVFQLDRRALLLTDDNLLQILRRFDEADATDEELQAVFLQYLRADVDVGLPHSLIHVKQRHALRTQLVRMHVDLILLHETSDARHLAHAFDGIELIAQIPVLDAAQFGEIEALALDGVPKDLAERRGIGTQHGDHLFRQPLLRHVHALQHS